MTQQTLLALRQELIAPVQRRTQRLMPGQCGTSSSRQQIETIVETGGDVMNAQRGRTRRRKLNGEWYSVETPTDCRDY